MIEPFSIAEFEERHPLLKVAYGGDGTLLSKIQECGYHISYLPLRDYGCCSEHNKPIQDILRDFDNTNHEVSNHFPLKMSFSSGNTSVECRGMAEIVVRSADPTSAIRFDVKINGKKYLSNCIADAFIYASEMGSHGYWKSVTRTIFRGDHTVGLGFIAPTYGINNLILDGSEDIKVILTRDSDVLVTADKSVSKHNIPAGTVFNMKREPIPVKICDYKRFCCYECRKNRNSTVLNDMYFS